MKRRFLQEGVSAVTDHRVTWLFEVIVLGIAIHALTEFLVEISGHRPGLVSILALVAALAIGLIIFFFASPVRALRDLLLSLRRKEVTLVTGPVPRYQGLIVLSSVGPGISSAENAIRYHWRGLNSEHTAPVLEVCWIITGGKASKESATNLINKLVQEEFPLKIFQPRALSSVDADNPEAVHRVVEEIYAEAKDRFNLMEEGIIADYTGGTKSMTSGMVLACTSPNRALQFMKPQRYTDDGRADVQAGSVPVAVDIRFELIPQEKK